jgi:diadenosine tetraphosphate (Ap4A) HIT family hydrolase
MSQAFQVDPSILAVSAPLAGLALCEARLMQDARYVWVILVPRRAGAVEIDDLSAADQQALLDEAVKAGAAVRAIGKALDRPIYKLNIAALGNVTPQLHVHVIGRRRDDAAWPQPVWGVGDAVAYSTDAVAGLIQIWAENIQASAGR